MITDDQAERAADWLRENARLAGVCRSERVYCEEFRKSLKAILMAEAPGKTAGDREAWAYAHERYQAHLRKLREAVLADEENRATREAAVMKIEVWRTQSSNLRGRL
jgi:hypothetical protein